MLHPVAQLGQHTVGDVAWGLGDKVDAHAFGADQLNHLLDLLDQGLGGVRKQHMGLVEEEHQLGFVQVSRLGQHLKQLREHPQQEAGVQRRVLNQLDAVQHVHHAPAVGRGAEPVTDIQVGFPEKQAAPLTLQRQEGADDGPQGLDGNIAVCGDELLPVLPHVAQHGPQVLHVQQQQAPVVGNLEYDVQHPLLSRREPQQAGEQIGPHVGYGTPHRMALFLINVPEGDGISPVGERRSQAELVDALFHPGALGARLRDAGYIPLHVAQKHRDPRVGKGLRHHLHRDRLTRAAGSGNQAVAVAHIQGHCHPGLAGQAQIQRAVCVHTHSSISCPILRMTGTWTPHVPWYTVLFYCTSRAAVKGESKKRDGFLGQEAALYSRVDKLEIRCYNKQENISPPSAALR